MKAQELTSTSDKTHEVYLITPGQVPGYAPLVEKLLEEVLIKSGETDHTVETVLLRIQRDVAQLWVTMDNEYNIRSLAVTELFTVNKTMYLRFWLVSGNLIDFGLDNYRKIELWALHNYGVTKVESLVRPGFAKHLEREMGFKRKQVRVVRHIPEAMH